jgi:prepilin-type processing-associated H-X9-DG protein
MHNHHDTLKVFPTGGNYPWPDIANYLTSGGGAPLGPDRQGLGWMFQILQYMEQSPVYDIHVQADLEQQIIGGYFCPSRARVRWQLPRVLNDYAGVTTGDFWKGATWTVPQNQRYYGVIVRTNWNDNDTNYPFGPAGSSPPTDMAQIVDGTSNTIAVGEKRLRPASYYSGDWHDDRGWTDGWDPDTMRSTAIAGAWNYRFGPDTDLDGSNPAGCHDQCGFDFGSAHPGGVNFLLADGSVRLISYTIDKQSGMSFGRWVG